MFVFFCVSVFLCCLYMSCEHSMYLLHIHVWLCKMCVCVCVCVLHSHIHEYGHVRNGWNGHRMLITIEHRNLGIRKHVTTSCSGTKRFYQLWVKGFDVRRRDTIFYAVLFIWPPTGATPLGRTFASRRRAPKYRSFSFDV